MAKTILQPGPGGVMAPHWVSFFVETTSPFDPKALQSVIDPLIGYPGLPAVEEVNDEEQYIHKVTLPLISYRGYLATIAAILERITQLEESTAVGKESREPANGLQAVDP